MKCVSPLSDTDLQVLSDAYIQGEKPALRRRAHAILLSNKGYTINQISDILAVRRGAVRRGAVSIWLKAWKTDGLNGLTAKSQSGRPAIYDEQDRELLKTLVAQTPHQIKAVQARLQEETGKTSCSMTIKRALKKSGV
jgi:transposase